MSIDELLVAHRVPDEASGVLLVGVLESQGIEAVLRSANVPGYGTWLKRDWSTTAWGEILVAAADVDEARNIIAEYVAALQQGGQLNDSEVGPLTEPDA
ncbi:MAG: DUF2007 domain-containing protein [Candidatus Eisenbacteria bacterium]